jgi:hypothetical protein
MCHLEVGSVMVVMVVVVVVVVVYEWRYLEKPSFRGGPCLKQKL